MCRERILREGFILTSQPVRNLFASSERQMNNLPIIQSLWIGDRLSVMEQLSISSFLKNGHSFHLYVYDELKGVPDGVVLLDADKIVRREKIFKYKDYASYAGFADLFRYRLLLEKGGYWVDTDVVCLRPFQLECDYVFASEKYRKFFLTRVRSARASCVIKAPIGSRIMGYCYAEFAKRDLRELFWGEMGPVLLTTAVKKFGLQCHVARAEIFCPINSWQWERSISGSFTIVRKEEEKMAMHGSRAWHLWNEMWRRSGVDKDADFPQNSLYEQLKRRYLNST